MTGLLEPDPEWVQLVDDEQGLVVVELDDAVVDRAPWPGFDVQLVLTVPVHEADEDGQPTDGEHLELALWREALLRALEGVGRLVATITAGGVREHVAYVRDRSVVEAWQTRPPPDLGSHEAQVVLVDDPSWLGLRQIAGLLAPNEEPLVLPG